MKIQDLHRMPSGLWDPWSRYGALSGIGIEHHTCLRSTDAPPMLHQCCTLTIEGPEQRPFLGIFVCLQALSASQNTPMDIISFKGHGNSWSSTDLKMHRYIASTYVSSQERGSSSLFAIILHSISFQFRCIVSFGWVSGLLSLSPSNPRTESQHTNISDCWLRKSRETRREKKTEE